VESEFTLAGYRNIVEALLRKGYEVRGFADAEPEKRHLILRHDLDMSIQSAVPMAEIERAMGVAATYFVLMRTEFYNPHSPASVRDLKRLLELGHAIGLHFDPALYPEDRTSLDRGAADECAALESIVGQPVTVISLHRPGKSPQGKLIYGQKGTLGGRRQADEPIYFQNMAYRSDSRGGWHYGHPLEHPALSEGRALEFLTHPIWWVSPGKDPAEKLEQFLAQRNQALDRAMGDNSTVYKPRSESWAAANPSCETRTLSPDDIRNHACEFLSIAADVEGEYWKEEHLLRDLPDKWSLSFAVWSANRPVAYAIVSRKAPHHAHLHHIMVATDMRRHGLGAMMMSEVESRARKYGMTILTLKVPIDSRDSRNFYAGLGYVADKQDGEYLRLSKQL
jgi:GNAT superfamily N-acetyltransferase